MRPNRGRSGVRALVVVTLALAVSWGGLETASAQQVRTLSAGVGLEGRVKQPDYSVRFEFAELAGPYLADVAVVVTAAGGGKVIEMVSEGPWLFADLAPGDYHVVATAKSGKRQTATFSVEAGAKQRAVRLVWR